MLYMDAAVWRWHGRRWGHLISDTSIDELHAFARRAELRHLWFGFDHYDVPDTDHERVLDLGVALIDSRDIVRRLRSAGLRTSLGKDAKRWRRSSLALAAHLRSDEPAADPATAVLRRHDVTPGVIDTALDALGSAPAGHVHSEMAGDVVWRPGELTVIMAGPERPADDAMRAVAQLVVSEVTVVRSTSRGATSSQRWTMELVMPAPELERTVG